MIPTSKTQNRGERDLVFLASNGMLSRFGIRGNGSPLWKLVTAAHWSDQEVGDEGNVIHGLNPSRRVFLTSFQLYSGESHGWTSRKHRWIAAVGEQYVVLVSPHGDQQLAIPIVPSVTHAPVFADLNGDCVHDMIVQSHLGIFVYSINIGTASYIVPSLMMFIIALLITSVYIVSSSVQSSHKKK